MINQLIKAMAKVLRKLYPEIPVYRDYPQADLQLPCFVIRYTGGNARRRITQGYEARFSNNERFTIEFFSKDVSQIYDVSYEVKVRLNEIQIDDGKLYRCFNKNIIMAITENHASITLYVRTDPYLKGEDLPRMTSLDLLQQVERED